MNPKEYAKAIVGALVAGLSAAAVALEDGDLTLPELLLATVATLVAFGVVFEVPNSEPKA